VKILSGSSRLSSRRATKDTLSPLPSSTSTSSRGFAASLMKSSSSMTVARTEPGTPSGTPPAALSRSPSIAARATPWSFMMAGESDVCRDAARYWDPLNEGWDAVFGSRFAPRGGGVIDYRFTSFITLYCWLEKYFSPGDYRKKSSAAPC
jgi:hypothetical protein